MSQVRSLELLSFEKLWWSVACSQYIWSCLLIIPALIEGARTILSENRSSVSEVDIKEAIEFQEERINALEGRRIIDVEAN